MCMCLKVRFLHNNSIVCAQYFANGILWGNLVVIRRKFAELRVQKKITPYGQTHNIHTVHIYIYYMYMCIYIHRYYTHIFLDIQKYIEIQYEHTQVHVPMQYSAIRYVTQPISTPPRFTEPFWASQSLKIDQKQPHLLL